MDCFAEPVLGIASGDTRGLAMTTERREPTNFRVGTLALIDNRWA